jgi:hypothetical protein
MVASGKGGASGEDIIDQQHIKTVYQCGREGASYVDEPRSLCEKPGLLPRWPDAPKKLAIRFSEFLCQRFGDEGRLVITALHVSATVDRDSANYVEGPFAAADLFCHSCSEEIGKTEGMSVLEGPYCSLERSLVGTHKEVFPLPFRAKERFSAA